MNAHRLFSLLLALSLTLLTVLTGCDKDTDTTASSAVTSSSTPTAPADYTGDTLVVYPEYDARIERDTFYDVTVTQGDVTKALTCYNHCDDVATSDRTLNGDTVRRFCEFAFTDTAVRVDIRVKCDFSSYRVMPGAKGFRSECHDNVISVYLDKPEYFLIKLDGLDDTILSVFADEPEYDVPDKNDPDVTYIEGWYEPEDGGTQLLIGGTDKTVYIAPGAVVNARVKIIGDFITLKGRGMILDPYSDIYHHDASEVGYDTDDNRYLLNVSGSYCTVDGVKLIDARDYNLVVKSSDFTGTNLKILASEMCTDGISQFSGKNNTYSHGFIYNGDNALVISGGDTASFLDITIGTMCSAIYPQAAVGTNHIIDGIYVFRCDEGLMHNSYNNGRNGTTARTFSLTLENVSAIDCDHFPFLFRGGNMGTTEKSITFRNCAVPDSSGTSSIGKGDGKALRFFSSGLDTANYILTFDGLSVGGKTITSASALTMSGSYDRNTIVVKGAGCTDMPAVADDHKVSVTAPEKIFIGNRQLFLANAPVQKDGTWYVPAEDVCRALVCDVPKDTDEFGSTIYVSLTALVKYGCTSSAKYDAKTKSIRIQPSTREDNLLTWFGTATHSYWGEMECYNTHLLYRADSDSYYNKDSSLAAGAYYNLTRQLQQYGAGTYQITVDLKADVATSARLHFAFNRHWTPKSFAITTQWQTISFSVTVPDEAITNAYLSIAGGANAGVSFRNAKVVYKG